MHEAPALAEQNDAAAVAEKESDIVLQRDPRLARQCNRRDAEAGRVKRWHECRQERRRVPLRSLRGKTVANHDGDVEAAREGAASVLNRVRLASSRLRPRSGRCR